MHMSMTDLASSQQPRARLLTHSLLGSHVLVGQYQIVLQGDNHNPGHVRSKITTEDKLTHSNCKTHGKVWCHEK